MKRLFWVALGATMGVLVVRKVAKVAQSYSPSGAAASFADGLSNLGDGLKEMAEAVREGMDEREAELRYALGLDTGTLPDGQAMTSDQARELIQDPTGPRAREGR